MRQCIGAASDEGRQILRSEHESSFDSCHARCLAGQRDGTHPVRSWVLCTATAALLAACGGGEGDTSQPGTIATAQVVSQVTRTQTDTEQGDDDSPRRGTIISAQLVGQ